MHALTLVAILAVSASALPGIARRENITSVYTTTGQIFVYTKDGSKVGCLEVTGKATSNTGACATFTSVHTTGVADYYNIQISNYSLATTEGFCGVTLHNGDDPSLNQDYGHVWECRKDMPLYEPPNSGYESVSYQTGVNGLIYHELITSGFSGFNSYWNTVGGAALNSTPAIMQARLPDYPLGSDFAFVPEFEPSQ